MSWKAIGVVYAKDLRDSLRDRRTLFSAILLPVFMMPVIILGMAALTSRVVSQAAKEVPRIMVVGGADSPGIRSELEKSGKFRIETATADWKQLIADKKVRAAVEVPPGFERGLDAGAAPDVTLYDFQGELRSGMAAGQLESFFGGLRDKATLRLLKARGLPASVARPFELRRLNVAPPAETGGNMVGGMAAYFIIMISIVGAMYPAMDLTAGEKERGTLETLLCAPVRRTDLVIGKFGVVLTIACGSITCAMISMTGTLAVMAAGLKAASGSGGGKGGIILDPLGVLGVFAMVLPVAVFFAAILFSASLFAKTMKEAQSYAVPIVLAAFAPVLVGLLPGIDLDLRLALVPVLNVSLVCREMLSGVWHWGYIALVFGSTAAYAAAALALAVRMFNSERVVFRN